jgi:hypothetical protein
MKKIKTEDMQIMLRECWETAKTYREFIFNISNSDCILLQLWLHGYITRMIKGFHQEEPWKITAKTIRSWKKVDLVITKASSQKKNYTCNVGGNKDYYTMETFLMKKYKNVKI